MLVMCVKVNGKVLREDKNVVKLPFGSEYSLFFKNMNNKRVAIKIEIDGENISDNDERFVIDANSTAELKRYLSKDNAFKFIEKTKEIEDYRGNRPEDGLIRVEYEYSIVSNNCDDWLTNNDNWTIHNNNDNWNYNHSSGKPPIDYIDYTWTTCSSSDYLRGRGSCCNNSSQAITYNANVAYMNYINTNGITVAGDETYQSFNNVNFIGTGITNVMVIQLIGYNCESDKYVEKPIFVTDNITCPTCGRKNKSKNKFCYNCGTCLR